MGCIPTNTSSKEGGGISLSARLGIKGNEDHHEDQKVNVHEEKHVEVHQAGNNTHKETTTVTTIKKTTMVDGGDGAIEQPADQNMHVQHDQAIEHHQEDVNIHHQEEHHVEQHVEHHVEQHVESTTITTVITTEQIISMEHEYKLDEVSTGEAAKYPITAWFKQEGTQYPMDIHEIEMGEGGLIRLEGHDAAGDFHMKGRFNSQGKVLIKKDYSNGDKFMYQGVLEMCKITGKWAEVINGKVVQTDDFGINFTLNKYNDMDDLYALASAKPCVGLAKTAQGWGVIKPDLGANGDEYTATIYYADGTNVPCQMNVSGELPQITINDEPKFLTAA